MPLGRILFPLHLCLLGVVATPGCSGEPPSDDGAPVGAPAGESRFGLMAVSYELDGAASPPALQLQARAQFVHFTEMDGDHVARLLGLFPSRVIADANSSCHCFWIFYRRAVD